MDLVPYYFKDFIYHKEIVNRLQTFNRDNISNLVFYGQNNSGKRTLINALINHISGKRISLIRKIRKESIKISNNKVNIEFIETPWHYEINLYEYGHYDKYIITEFFKYILSFKNINLNYKLVVLHHFDKITRVAQLALRRIIEKSHEVGRFILCCENIGNIDKPLLSRFESVRVPKPKECDIREFIRIKTKSKKMSIEHENEIVLYTNRSIYAVNLLLENYFICGKINKDILLSKEDILKQILIEINKPNLESIITIREIAYKYLLLNLKPYEIFKMLFKYYANSSLDTDIKNKIIAIAANLDSFSNNIDYDIFILEYFVICLKELFQDIGRVV